MLLIDDGVTDLIGILFKTLLYSSEDEALQHRVLLLLGPV